MKDVTIIDATSQFHSYNKQPQIPLRDIGLIEFIQSELQETPKILPWLHVGDLVMVHAFRGRGKTFFALNIAFAIACGDTFLCWKTSIPKKVLYIDGEMSLWGLKERLIGIMNEKNKISHPGDDYFRILADGAQKSGLPYLDTLEGQSALRPFTDKADVIFVDNLSCLTHLPENDSQSWIPVQNWLLRLRRSGKTVVLLHHTGKGGLQRGSSRREDILNVVLNLEEPKDYELENGVAFQIKFEKARGLHGDVVLPLDVWTECHNGMIQWRYRRVKDALLERILELEQEGLKTREISQELGMSIRQIYRVKAERKTNPHSTG